MPISLPANSVNTHEFLVVLLPMKRASLQDGFRHQLGKLSGNVVRLSKPVNVLTIVAKEQPKQLQPNRQLAKIFSYWGMMIIEVVL